MELNKLLDMDFCVEECDFSDKDRELMRFVTDNCERNEKGRYILPALWNNEVIDRLPNNYNLSYNILKSSTKTLNSSQLAQYDEVITKQLNDGIIELVNDNAYSLRNSTDVSFMAHKAVFRVNAESTKCRIVYLSNLAEKGTGNNLSHNQVSFPGPNLNPKLSVALTLLRFNKYLLIYDLEKAFHQLCLKDIDSKKLCFLWYKNLQENCKSVVAYKFVRVPFGMRFSPFLLMMSLYLILILHANIITEKENLLRNTLYNLAYMDNLSFSAQDYDQLKYAYEKSHEIFNAAGFNLQQFHSNCDLLSKQFVEPSESSECKLLGITWNFVSDNLYNKKIELDPLASTKREILSSCNSVFDPLGLLIPVMNRAKLFLHTLQMKGGSWDSNIGHDEQREWSLICKQFNSSMHIAIPRYVGDFNDTYEIVAFSDASKDLYGCVIYLRDCTSRKLKFIAAKNRVISKNNQSKSIPVLELFSMQFTVEVAIDIYNDLANAFMPVKISNIHIYVDSMISLNWLSSKVNKFDKIERKGSCINNKLDSIEKLCKSIPVSFHHICGLDNPADKVSRCTSANVLSKSTYLNGPVLPNIIEPMVILPRSIDSNQIYCNSVDNVAVREPLVLFEKFSSIDKLCRIYHYVNKFIYKIKSRMHAKNVISPIIGNRFIDSKLLLLRQAQELAFPNEISDLKAKCRNRKVGGLITQLNLFLDSNGLIRVRGKIESVGRLSNYEYPILLHKDCHITSLIIESLHKKVKHVGIYKVLNLLQKEFWVPCALRTIKKVVNKCIMCKKLNGRTIKINQNSYRNYRIDPIQIPFREIAIDHIGPFNVKIRDENNKYYILIVTCYFTRAVNLLLCKNIDNRSFLLAFQEHIFSYGIPSRIISDNGSPIVSSIGYISELLNNVDVKNFLTEHNIEHLKFEPYPAQASYLGGIVESLVKQVKYI